MPRSNDDPRARRSRAAALAAATELLIEGGPEKVTHAAVAQRAGVGRATIYRHWPDQQALLLDALADEIRPLLAFFTDRPVRDQLIAQMEQLADRLNKPGAVSVIATIMERAERDEDVRRLREEMYGRVDERFAEALAADVERGALRPGVEEHARDLASHIVGPLLFHRFLLGTHIDKDLLLKAIDTALAPWLPNA